jgi:hypothetical protein
MKKKRIIPALLTIYHILDDSDINEYANMIMAGYFMT